MPRPAAFSRETLIDATRALAAAGGPAQFSIEDLGKELGAPTGSIYYRFKSRDELLARVWFDSVEAFQSALFAEAEGAKDPGALAAAVVHWCRTHHTLARVLTLYRCDEWLGARVSKATQARARALNKPVAVMLKDRACAWFGRATPRSIDATRLAVVSIPTAGVKDYLQRDQRVPEWVAGSVAAAARAVVQEARQCR